MGGGEVFLFVLFVGDVLGAEGWGVEDGFGGWGVGLGLELG